jgi:hypothetical protein
MADHEAPPAASSIKLLDALDRAWRTFYAAVGVDLILAIGLGMQQLMIEQDPFTSAFWWMLLVLVVKSILAAIASFFLRYAKKPAVPTAAESPLLEMK